VKKLFNPKKKSYPNSIKKGVLAKKKDMGKQKGKQQPFTDLKPEL